MSRLKRLVPVSAWLVLASISAAQTPLSGLAPGYYPTGPNGYIYIAPRAYATPPPYGLYGGGYGYGGYGYGGYGYGLRPLPPAGFGSPYYNGYNDPYYGSYGPGVQNFLGFGGADFYGW